MDEIIAAFLKQSREDQGISRVEFAPLVALSIPVYGRCERAFSRMTVTRMIHLCELLGFMPNGILFEAAPHLRGRTQEEAEDRRTLTKLIERLPHDTMRDLIRLLQRLTPGEKTADAVASIAGG